ncbi:MAG: hypothetical protein IT388_06915 [Nitrospirales bacterium]|nr:hypothetical protein [Nitrospirales bacterium]
MPKVSVESLKPGMKLAKPVVNESGMILLGEGTELTEVHIERLRNMTIGSVAVAGSAQPQKSKAELLSALDARFRKTEDEPYMSLIKRVFAERIEELNR